MREHTSCRLLWGILLFVSAGIIGAGLWAGLGSGSKREGSAQRVLEGLDRFGTVPDFSLTERSGRRLSRADFKGKIWIANFIYTSCKDTCPLQSAEMAKLQGELAQRENLRLVSISVDPERDNPQVLSRYAERFHAQPEFWLFLTGEGEAIRRLAQEGFRLSAVPASDVVGKDGPIILHSSRFVLVDGQARIRGYYDSQDPEASARLRQDVKKLFHENEA
jgi:cytochrome oxidase Cu insertion factor (SCO1/SenC/PrrC family)